MTIEEISRLIIEYGKPIYSFCCSLTGNKNDADDLYQDTVLKAVELRHRLDSGGNPKCYLMGIAVRIWQNHKKKYAVRQKILQTVELDENLTQETEDTDSRPDEKVIRKETIRAVRMGMKQLPEKFQIVLYMYYTAEMSLEDIGRTLRIPQGTIKSRLFKGRNLLKEYLEVRDYE
jgi:RNA polymerase sigma-70 factor (ECF subfamily)